ncbi:TlpA family protein disulfide reductase [bacterium]|nr:TlpA family protein disulfide reductase [bacterium]
MKKFLCLILACTSLLLAGSALPANADTSNSNVALASRDSVQYLPPIDLVSSNKGKVDGKKMHYQVLIIDVWASWCGPCRNQIPILHELKKKYGNKLEIIGISVDSSEADHKKAIKQLNISYPSCLSANKTNAAFLEAMQKATGQTIRGIPHLVIVDGMGHIVYARSGMHPKGALEDIIKPIIDKKG